MFFSSLGGLAETCYVFLEGNRLSERFAKAEKFVIGETGFGSGLNFIAVVDSWLQTAPADACLHYISFEKHPFTEEDLSKALSVWPELQYIATELLQVYPPLVHGFHYRTLFNGRVRLSLLYGDALELLSDLNAKVDAWFLDGFAPAKNESLWSDKLFQLIATRTTDGGSFATFTAASDVRRGLLAAGFQVSKRAGFGKKREMLIGYLDKTVAQATTAPWFSIPVMAPAKEKHALVIGAGIAGITTAVSLAERGWKISLIEQHDQVASEASGNPAGVVMPRLTADMSLDARFYLAAFLYTTHWLNNTSDTTWHSDGVLQLLDADKCDALKEVGLPESVLTFLSAQELSEKLAIQVPEAGVHYPLAGWLKPSQLCGELLQQHPSITFITGVTIEGLDYHHGQWSANNSKGLILEAPVVVIAAGSDAQRLLPESELGLTTVRGQLSYSSFLAAHLSQSVCYDGYIIPMTEADYCIGATYDRHSNDRQLSEKDHQANLAALQKALPDIKCDQVTGGRVAFRASTQDHLPLVGPAADTEFFLLHYVDLCHGRPVKRYPSAEYRPGLYINTGHGSRGLTSCPLAAEMIASMVNAEPLPIAEDIRQALHPARFLIRELKRRRGE